MLKDITLGQYYPADSVIHRLDPRVKLFATLIFIISLFCFKGPLGFALILVFMGVFIKMSKVPLSYMLRGLRAIVILLVIAGAFNLFLSPGEALVSLGPLTITDTGLRNAVLMTVRMVFLIVGTSVMTLTTTPNQLTDGMEKALRPLNKIHVPVHEISMMMSIALRFIPTLVEETDKIMAAQKARGADLESGGLMQRAKALVPILIPLFISAFRRAEELALAMECRCYHGGEGRTRMKQLHLGSADFLACGVMAVILCALIGANFLPIPW